MVMTIKELREKRKKALDTVPCRDVYSACQKIPWLYLICPYSININPTRTAGITI